MNGIRECFESAKVKYKDVEDYWLSWDLIKIELRGYTIAFSKKMRQNRDRVRRSYKTN